MNAPALLAAAGGLIGWAAAFASVYALHGVGCAAGWERLDLGPVNLQRGVLVLAWAAWMLLLALWARQARRRRTRGEARATDGSSRLLLRLAEGSAWAGLAATVVSLMPVATHAVCL